MSILDDIASVFTAPVDAVQDVVSWLQWISWIFNPINWLRAVEFITGAVLFGFGLNRAVRDKTGVNVGGQVKSFAKDVAAFIPK